MTTERAAELILAVDDNHEALYALEQTLLHRGYRVETASDGAEALEKAAKFRPAVIFMDVVMPRLDGYFAVRKLKADPELRYTPVILLTAKDSLEDIIKGLDAGADDYIVKPFEPDELLARLRSSLRLRSIYSELRKSEDRNSVLLEQLSSQYNFGNIVGESPAMKRVFAMLEKVIDVDSPVLITGPSGTGKELIARAIHFNSRRRTGSFIAVNCAAISENLLESELFGHLKGAFTGALRDKIGLFEAADGGTLFLDEIGEMSGTLQPKLLRVLQEGTFLPVGSTEERHADVRILAATNRELLKLVEEGRFRDDLYYRLNVINVDLPPLRERREDILPIAEHILARIAEERGQPLRKLSPEAAEMLKNYSWRGNVRELQNEIERLLILGQNDTVLSADLLSARILEEYYARDKGDSDAESGSLRRAVDDVERKMIQDALVRFGGNKTATAKELGMSRSSLISKVQQYGLEKNKKSSAGSE